MMVTFRFDRKVDQPHFDADEHFIHPCCICGEHANFGFGVSLRNGKLGKWYCGKCVSYRDREDERRR